MKEPIFGCKSLFFGENLFQTKKGHNCQNNIDGNLPQFKGPLLIIKNIFKFNPDDKILDWFKLKQIADNILKCI